MKYSLFLICKIFFSKQVCTWLSEIFDKKGGVPNFPVNKQTVSHLHKLMCHNAEMDRIGELAVQDLNQMKEEYQFEGICLIVSVELD